MSAAPSRPTGVPQVMVLATGNAGKLREMKRILAPLGCELLAQECWNVQPGDEPHTTFSENARVKAWRASCASGLPALAEDSGLCVDTLGGAPGVRSARYAGEHANAADNNRKLLAEMAGKSCRTASFRCAAVLLDSSSGISTDIVREGVWRGAVAAAPKGAEGFGYDPIFLTADGRSAAELSGPEKDALSHRGKALHAIVQALTGN